MTSPSTLTQPQARLGLRPPRRKRGDSEESLFQLKFGALRRAFFRQSPAFWFISLYIFFEYVRPQSIYTWMDVAPWALMSLVGAVISVLVERRAKFESTTLWMLIFAFTAVIVLSSATAYFPMYSWESKVFWFNWLLLMFVVGAGIKNRTELLLFLVAFFLWNLKMSQHGTRSWIGAGFRFVSWGAAGGPGWFQNSGEFGIQMCIFLPLVGYASHGLWPHLSKYTKWSVAAITATGLISIIATSSRGAMIGLAGVGLWMLVRSPNRLRSGVVVLTILPLMWFLIPDGSKERFSEMGSDSDSLNRLRYWGHGIEILKEHPLLGVGYKNWLPYYRTYYNPEGQLPHNYFVEAGAELGGLGLAILIAIFVAYFWQNAKTRRATRPNGPRPDRFLHSLTFGLDGAMIGFMVSGFFITVLYYPYIWMNVALCLAVARVAAGDESRRLKAKVRRGATARFGSAPSVTPANPLARSDRS